MIDLKSAREIGLIEESCQIAAEILYRLKLVARPGVTTKWLDDLAYAMIVSCGAEPSFKGYRLANLPPFPGSITTSINEEIVHGIPGDRELKSGDLLKLDIGVLKNGYHGDTAITVLVGSPKPKAKRLADVTKTALKLAIDVARPGNTIGDLGFAIQKYVESHGYSVVRDFVGHGLGKSLHEDPQVPHYGRRGRGAVIQEGMVFCLEPMINEGTYRLRIRNDQWTAVTADGRLSAQFEHALAITSDGARILTLHESERDFYIRA
ncbi:MAG: type I methionyl aminopeptidase [Candidatus Coatesbacteria bacterium]|nr:type I methionyl aminopeptidase [Candidatus Coatesbacteria bacterium]